MKPLIQIRIALILILLTNATYVFATTPASVGLPLSYLCYKTATPIVIDGQLHDTGWIEATWTTKFVDIEGDLKPLPRFDTQAKMCWDDKYFYVAAQLQEPHIWGTLTKRDAVIFHDNDFELFMDPNGDNYEYGELEINALNTVWDLMLPKPYRDDGHAVDSWDIEGLKTAVHCDGTINQATDTDSGWSVEIAIPWSSLEKISHSKTAPKENEQWHINFSRVEWLTEIVNGTYKKIEKKPEDNWVWTPQGEIAMHMPEKWGLVQFTSAKPGSAKLLPDPAAHHRTLLHKVYYAEKKYFELNKRYTDRLDSLVLSKPTPPLTIAIRLTDEGFTAKTIGDPEAVYSINQDSHFLPIHNIRNK